MQAMESGRDCHCAACNLERVNSGANPVRNNMFPEWTSGSGPCDICGEKVACGTQILGDGIIAICESCNQKYPSPPVYLHRAAYIRGRLNGVVLNFVTGEDALVLGNILSISGIQGCELDYDHIA